MFLRIGKVLEVPFDLKKPKISMYKVLVRPVLKCASEAWTLSKIDEQKLSVFERKVLRCIFGAK